MPRNPLVPEGAWDTHIHVFDPEKYLYSQQRSYTPKSAFITEYPTDSTGCTGIVVVHASIQGSSPAALVDTLSKNGTNGFTLRGLMTVDPDGISDAELDKLHEQGVRGARLHLMSWGHGEQSAGDSIWKKVEAVANKVARLGWVVGVFCPLPAWAYMAPNIRKLDSRVKLVADHFGGTFPGDEKSDDFETFLDLIREKKLYVKVSGFERLYEGHGTGREGMKAIEPMVKAVIEAGPDQIVYGSDWPHTQLGVSRKGKTDQQRLDDTEGFRDVPDDIHIQVLREWITADATWQKLFVTNSEKLFR